MDLSISQLPQASSINFSDEFAIAQSGTTRSIDYSTLLSKVQDDITIKSQNIDFATISPIWETVVSTLTPPPNTSFTLSSTTGKSYVFKDMNGGACMYMLTPPNNQRPSVVETYSIIVYNKMLNEQSLRVCGIAPSSKVHSCVHATIGSGNGVGPRSTINTAGASENFATIVSMGGEGKALCVHTIAQPIGGNSNAWTIFAEAKLIGSQTSYTGVFECTAESNMAVPGVYQQGTSNAVASCKHVWRIID